MARSRGSVRSPRLSSFFPRQSPIVGIGDGYFPAPFPRMKKKSFEISHLVEFYETDMAGVVHFSNFFRYLEKCEHAFARSLDIDSGFLAASGSSAWPRVHASCDYREPARYGDVLTIRLFITEVRNRSVRYRFEVLRDQDLLAEATMVVAHVTSASDGSLRATPLPDGLRSALADHLEKLME